MKDLVQPRVGEAKASVAGILADLEQETSALREEAAAWQTRAEKAEAYEARLKVYFAQPDPNAFMFPKGLVIQSWQASGPTAAGYAPLTVRLAAVTHFLLAANLPYGGPALAQTEKALVIGIAGSLAYAAVSETELAAFAAALSGKPLPKEPRS
jgi:hypothetical protein